MVLPGKTRPAPNALNAVLVRIRHMAYSGESHAEIARFLDHAEYLPMLLADAKDRTGDLREVLVTLATIRSDFHVALDRFDEDDSPT